MADIVNDRDVLLQAASVRKLTTAGVAVVPTTSSSNFYARADGSHGPDYVRISVATILCDGPFTFAVQGAKLSNVTATTADITYADMTSPLAIVTVTAANAGAPVQGSCIIGLVSDGQPAQNGVRGAGQYYIPGSAWSDAAAKSACPGGNPVAGDVVTISNGSTYALTKKYDGTAWNALGAVYDGSLFVTGTINGAAIKAGTLEMVEPDGTPIIRVGSPLNPAYAAAGTKNSAITVNADGSLNNAGGGKVTLPGIGQDMYRIFTKSNTATNAPGLPVGLYKNGSIIHGVQRSYSLVVIQRSSGNITWQKDYDVYGAGEIGGAKAYDLALDLNNLADAAGQYIVIVYTFDEPRNRREESGLMQAMYRNGASRGVFGSSQFQSWSAYALVGISGCGEGNGAEAYQGAVSGDPNAWIDVSFGVVAGNLTGVTLNYVPKTLQDYGYTGDMNATSDITLVARGSIALSGNRAVKAAGSAGNWDSDVYSTAGFSGGAYATARIDGLTILMFGLNADPTADAYYGTLDYAMYPYVDGYLHPYMSGNHANGGNPIGTYGAGDVLGVKYDGSRVSWTKNGTELFAVQRYDASVLYFDSSFLSPGASLSNISLTPMTSNNWSSVGGAGKPQDNATVGAPSGTYVGGTEAGLLASRALNGDQAYNALPGINSAIASKLSAGSRNVLAGGAGIAVGSITWDGAGDYIGGYGVAINNRGIVAYNTSGENTLFLSGSDGTAAFKGAVYAQSGYIGGMNLYSGALCTGGYTGWAWPGQDGNGNWLMGGYFGPQGILLGNKNSGKWFQATYDGYIGAPGFELANGVLTLTGIIINSPTINGASMDAFTASLSGSAGGSYANTSSNVGYGTLTANPSGGRAPYSYQWTLTESNRTGNGRMFVSGSTTAQSCGLVGFGSTCTNEYRITCVITDANGRTATLGRSVTANHGTPP